MIKRWIVFIAFLSFTMLIPSCSASSGQSTPTPVPTPATIQKPTYQVQRGTIVKVLRLQGRVAPVNQQDLFFRSDGYVQTVNRSYGDQVKTGDVLAELELGDLAIQLSQAQLALQQAETKLAQSEQENANALIEAQLELDKVNLQAQLAGALGINPSIEEAQAVVDRAEDALKLAERKLHDGQENPISSDAEIKKLEEAVEKAKWELDSANAKLKGASTQDEFDQHLAQAQETLEATLLAYHESVKNPELTSEESETIQQNLKQAKENYINTWLEYAAIVAGPVSLSTEAQVLSKELALARLRVEELKLGVDPMLVLDVEQRRLDLQAVQETVNRSRLIAPFDGQIIFMNLAPGRQVPAFQAVLTLADPSAMEIVVLPSIEDLTFVSIGQAVTVEWLNRAGQTDLGHIYLMPYKVDASTGKDQDQVLHISLDDPNSLLVMGEAATVVIDVGKREDVLWLPPAALRTFQGRDFVFVQENGIQRRVDVSLGLQSADRVEILEGLKEGQTVVGP